MIVLTASSGTADTYNDALAKAKGLIPSLPDDQDRELARQWLEEMPPACIEGPVVKGRHSTMWRPPASNSALRTFTVRHDSMHWLLESITDGY